MEEDKGVTITYETLFEMLRRERERLELQKLENSFFDDVASYLKEKQGLADGKGPQQELFTKEEGIKTGKQLTNVKRILRELYEKREKKIINMALDKSRTKSDLMDTSTLLDPEKSLFESLAKTLDSCRENVLLRMLSAEPVGKIGGRKGEAAGAAENAFKEASALIPDEGSVRAAPEKSTKLIRFKHAVPKFVGLEGEELGPFDEEDMASLPKEIANVLINKERAEEINQGD